MQFHNDRKYPTELSANTKIVQKSQTIQEVQDSCANPSISNPYRIIVPPGHENDIYTSIPYVFVSYEGFGSLHAVEPGAYGLHTTHANKQKGYFEHSLLSKGARFYGGIIPLNEDIAVTNGSFATKKTFYLPGVFSSATLVPYLGLIGDLTIDDGSKILGVKLLLNDHTYSKILIYTNATTDRHQLYNEKCLLDLIYGTGGNINGTFGFWKMDLQAYVTGGNGTIHKDGTAILLMYQVV